MKDFDRKKPPYPGLLLNECMINPIQGFETQGAVSKLIILGNRISVKGGEER